jgi:hypothetical protein
MKRTIQTRSQKINWLTLIRREAEEKQDRLLKAKKSDRNQDEIDRLGRIIFDTYEEISRHSLALRIHGEPMTVLV